MSKTRVIRDDIRYVLFTEVYRKLEEPKAKRKAFLILDAAILCLARKGFDGVTLEMIAREAAVTRPLIKYYFDDLSDLLETTIKYIRLFFQKFVVNRMLNQTQSDRILEEYIEACFVWVEDYKIQADVWLAFLHRCSRTKKERSLNTAAVEVGEARIVALLKNGKESGEFKVKEPVKSAKIIQTIITGALVTFVSEDLADRKEYKRLIRDQCLAVAQADRSGK